MTRREFLLWLGAALPAPALSRQETTEITLRVEGMI